MGGDVAERERGAERGGGTKAIPSGNRASRGSRNESSRSAGRGSSRGSTYPVYRGARGARGGEYTRRSRGPPPRFQKKSYRDEDYFYYEEYHPRMHRERKVRYPSCGICLRMVREFSLMVFLGFCFPYIVSISLNFNRDS